MSQGKEVHQRIHLSLFINLPGNLDEGKGNRSMSVKSGGCPMIKNQGAKDKRLKV